MGLSDNLRNARKRKGMTQLAVSRNIGISNTALSNYETGYRQPDLDTLKHLANYYEISIDELVETADVASEILIQVTRSISENHATFKGKEYSLSDADIKDLQVLLEHFFTALSLR